MRICLNPITAKITNDVVSILTILTMIVVYCIGAVQISSDNEIFYWISLVILKDLGLFENQASQSISFWPSQCCPN